MRDKDDNSIGKKNPVRQQRHNSLSQFGSNGRCLAGCSKFQLFPTLPSALSVALSHSVIRAPCSLAFASRIDLKSCVFKIFGIIL